MDSPDCPVHALGNGRMIVYSQGADILHVYGEPYSTQSLLTTRWECATARVLEHRSSRERGTLLWQHELVAAGQVLGHVAEVLDPVEPLYLCQIQVAVPLTLTLPLPPGTTAYPLVWNEEVKDTIAHPGILLTCADTQRVLFQPVGVPAYLGLIVWGSAFAAIDWEAAQVRVRFTPGAAQLVLSGNTHYPTIQQQLARVSTLSFAACAAASRRQTTALLERLTQPPMRPEIPDARAQRILAAGETTALTIVTQQGSDGGILAGYPFPLAYVRDQYGVARGLLALGLHDEARRNLLFRWRKWQRFGTLANAESSGHDRLRHQHENDAVEQTAYTLLQAVEFVTATGDMELLATLHPMLHWCLTAQLPYIRDGLLPFNGDETYIANGLLARSHLLDGSFEASLLFVEAASRYVTLCRQQGLLTPEQIVPYAEAIASVATQFRRHFWREGRWVANAPARNAEPAQPAYRHGVCEGCGVRGFGWTQRTATGRYLCPACLATVTLPPGPPDAVPLYAPLLLPPFINATLLTPEEQAPIVAGAVHQLLHSGGHPFMGYEPGLLLAALTRAGDPAQERSATLVLDLMDGVGTWAEWYTADQQPMGARYRPWESAINLAALFEYVTPPTQHGPPAMG